jgi:hypothetical protein
VSLLSNTDHRLLFQKYCRKSMFNVHRIHCSPGTVPINLSHSFLIKRLRERHRHRYCSPLPFTPNAEDPDPSCSFFFALSFCFLLFLDYLQEKPYQTRQVYFTGLNATVHNPAGNVTDRTKRASSIDIYPTYLLILSPPPVASLYG